MQAGHACAPRGARGIFIASSSLQLVIAKTASPFRKPVIARGLKPDVRQKRDAGQEKACYVLASGGSSGGRCPPYVMTSTRRVAWN